MMSMTEKSTEEYLIDIFKLKEVPQDKEWCELLENAEVRTYKKNEVILKQHLRFTDVLFVAEGILASEFTMKDKTVIGRFLRPEIFVPISTAFLIKPFLNIRW
jgi:CRP-like cAMP-binding protein